MTKSIDELAIATIRSLIIDITNNAKSGHPGMAIGSAPMVYTLFKNHLVNDPTHPDFINRDRFVLSSGHNSALLYSILHLCEYGLSLDDLKNFRQLGSITPGHPENILTPGVDVTSGPLGQGIAQAVGLAIAEAHLRAIYRNGEKLINHYTYCLCGDGCLQEGISQEAISLAGNKKLNKLILIYDDNGITLDGELSLSSSDDVKKRFLAVNWNVIEINNGDDLKALDNALKVAKRSTDKPTLIWMKTIIGYGSIKQGTNKVHGSPLGDEDGKHAKEVYGFNHEEFFIPEEVRNIFRDTFVSRGKKAYEDYQKSFEEYKKDHRVDADRFLSLANGDVSDYLPNELPDIKAGEVISTRAASGKMLNAYALALPNLIGGSADVASSVVTKIEGSKYFGPNSYDGTTINFGIREFAMASIQNGILLHGGLKSFVGSFFVFSDYMKPAIRMAALSKIPAVYLFSHDSIALGEDGPTHQPIEQLAMLRSIPDLTVIRPADAKELSAAYRYAFNQKEIPTALILSRQGLPVLNETSVEGVDKGAYIVSKEKKHADYILIATGSEVSLAIEVQKLLLEDKIDTRVVSMPSWEIFEKQDEEYKTSVIGKDTSKNISLEMLSTFGWDKYAKYHFGIDTFGLSGKDKDVINHFGFTREKIVERIKNIK